VKKTIDIASNKEVKRLGGKYTIVFEVATSFPHKVYLTLFNPNKPNTVYVDRYKTVNGVSTFYCRMPQSPKELGIYIRNKQGSYANDTFRVRSRIEPLKTDFTAFNSQSQKIRSFVKFAQWFAENSSILSVGDYMSDDGMFKIHLRKELRAKTKDGKVYKSTTPSRVGINTGIIEVNQGLFDKITVFGRVAILLHEFSHFYLNEVPENEFEADYNATNIYLGYGYPRIEALRNYIRTFTKNPTDENVARYKELERHINNFGVKKFKI